MANAQRPSGFVAVVEKMEAPLRIAAEFRFRYARPVNGLLSHGSEAVLLAIVNLECETLGKSVHAAKMCVQSAVCDKRTARVRRAHWQWRIVRSSINLKRLIDSRGRSICNSDDLLNIA